MYSLRNNAKVATLLQPIKNHFEMEWQNRKIKPRKDSEKSISQKRWQGNFIIRIKLQSVKNPELLIWAHLYCCYQKSNFWTKQCFYNSYQEGTIEKSWRELIGDLFHNSEKHFRFSIGPSKYECILIMWVDGPKYNAVHTAIVNIMVLT